MKVFLEAFLLQYLLTLYIAYRGGQALPQKSLWRKGFHLLMGVVFTLYLIGFAGNRVLPDAVMSCIMSVTGFWFVMSIYAMFAMVIVEIARVVDKRFLHRFDRLSERVQARIRLGLFVLIGLSSALLVIHGLNIVRYPVVKHMDIRLDRPAIDGRQSMKVALLTDIHISETVTADHIREMVERTLAERPDIVLIGGDMIDYHGRYARRDSITEYMRRLQDETPLGAYYVLGNHEYRADEVEKREWFRSIGHLVIDQVVTPGNAFYLIGRDDSTNVFRAPLHKLMPHVDTTKASILLDHQPHKLDSVAMTGVDLALYGHTHNGQIWPFTILTQLAFEKSWGYLRKGHTQFYVSSGVGAAGPAIRVFTESEIVILNVRFASENKPVH